MEDPQRPLPPRSPSDRARGWIEWFGLGRIVASALAMVIVCAGAYWLVQTPPPPTEAMLPVVTTTTIAPGGPSTTGPPGPESVPGSATAIRPLASPSVIVVHVAGAVAMPGVYELAPNARVQRAIEAAGGPLPDADPNTLNLAAPLSDGARIYVPRIGEVVPPTVAAPGPPVDASAGPVEGVPTIVDVNTASAVELEALPGVGPATATAIVAERDRNGPFLSVDDLDRVPGIGPTKIEALRELVST